MSLAFRQVSSGISRSARHTAELRLAAIAKSQWLESAASATFLSKRPESARTIGRRSPSGSAPTARAMSPGAWGRGSDLPEPKSAASTTQASDQTAGGPAVVEGDALLFHPVGLDVGRV